MEMSFREKRMINIEINIEIIVPIGLDQGSEREWVNASDEREVLGQSLFELAGAPVPLAMWQPVGAGLRRELPTAYIAMLVPLGSVLSFLFRNLMD